MIFAEKLKTLFKNDQRKKTAHIWLAANIAYDFVRTFVIGYIFKKNGIDSFTYLLYVLSFSVVFSVCSFRLVVSVIDQKTSRILFYGLASFTAFFAPDAYVVLAGHDISPFALILLGLYLLFTVTVTCVSIIKDIHKRKNLSE